MLRYKMIVCIDGNIGAGKSTIIKKLNECGFHTELEKIEKWPLDLFYNDPVQWSLALHMAVIHSMKNPLSGVHERCPVSTRDIFWKLSPKTPSEDAVFQEYLERSTWKPDVHILIDVPPDECLKHIKKRNQVGDDHVTLDYLIKLDEMYKSMRFDYVINGLQDPSTVVNIVKHIIEEYK